MDEVIVAKTQLEKKATFEAGITTLLRLAEQRAAPPAALLPAAQRAHALLKARYSNPAWLKLGARLFSALLANPGGGLDAAQRAKVDGFGADLRRLLGDEAEGEGAAPRERTLGELLGIPPPQARASHLSDAGLVLEQIGGAAPGQGPGAGQGAGEDMLQLLAMYADAGQGGPQERDSGDGQQREQQEQQQGQQRRDGSRQQQEGGDDRQQEGQQRRQQQDAAAPQLPELTSLAGLQALLAQLLARRSATADGGQQEASGAGDGQPGGDGQEEQSSDSAGDGEGGVLGALSADVMLEELEIMMATIESEAGAAQPPSRPPASRKVVASLPVVKIDAAAAARAAAAGETCPVCCEQWREGEEQQRLPCGHSFHPGCNAPWLAQHNSCAICRHELPTDDHAYEARKERAAAEEEDRRGAAAALSHNEFMYT